MEAPAVTTGIQQRMHRKIQKKQVCYASHEHEEFVVHVEKTIHLISLLFFWIYFKYTQSQQKKQIPNVFRGSGNGKIMCPP